MSYFYCSAGLNETIIENELIGYFYEIIPNNRRKTAYNILSGKTKFVNFGDNKVISDIRIEDGENKSWLTIVGTPLVDVSSSKKQKDLLDSFLNNPEKTIQDKIDGSYAIFCYDAKNKKLIVGTDYNASIPIFYAKIKNDIIFTSHELVLCRYLNEEIDSIGFAQAIYVGAVWHSFSRYKNIKKLVPNQLLYYNKDNNIRIENYWQPHNEQMIKKTFSDTVDDWSKKLTGAISKYYQCAGGKKVMCDFTAGEDSRLLIAACHFIGIPFTTQVMGDSESLDVKVAQLASSTLGIELITRKKTSISQEQLLKHAIEINCGSDAYQGFFTACTEYATEIENPIDDYNIVKLCGVPGGEAFRGAYYLRGKVLSPLSKKKIDYKFFTKMKWLLDFHPGLLKIPNDEFISIIYRMVNDALKEVDGFAAGTQIDHLLRMFQTSNLGLRYKNPLYLPFATKELTKSIYNLNPNYKCNGLLTKACTEMFYPKLAYIKNQNGVPTIKKTIMRMHLFLPEYYATLQKIYSGAVSRLFKIKKANKWYYSINWNAPIFMTLLSKPPYCNWFKTVDNMRTGYMYNPDILHPIIEQARTGSTKYVPIIDRVITQELAVRWIKQDYQ